MKKKMDNGNININKKRRFHIMDFVVIAAAIVIIGLSFYKLMEIYTTYRQAEGEYNEISKYAEIASSSIKNNSENADATDSFPDIHIDFDKLKLINDEIVGWIYIPALEISYPVTQADDNDYYLHYTYEKTANSSGCVFMDCDSPSDLSDRNTFVYGHNMKNGSMFGKLKKFRSEKGLCDSNPYFYYFTPEKSYKFRIFSYYVTTADSDSYYSPETDEQYDNYIAKLCDKSDYAGGQTINYSGRQNLMTLSTCSGRHTNYRMLVHGILDSVKTAGQETK